MAIAFDAESHVDYGSTLSWSHTCAANTSLYVFVRDDGNGVTGITFNGVALTLIDTQTGYFVYGITGAASGTHTIAVAGASTIAASAMSYTNTPTVDAHTKTLGTSGTTISTTLSSTVDNCWFLYFVEDRSGSNPSANTNTTQRSAPGGGASMTAFDSNGPKTPAGSFTQVANAQAATAVAFMVSIAPATPFDAADLAWKANFPDILLDTSVECVDSGFVPRSPADPTDPTPN